MRRALLLLLALCACSLRGARTTAPQACASTAQCDRGSVCFLGECRGGTASLALVSAEVHPTNDSQFGLLQQSNIDLRASVIRDFELKPPFTVAGVVRQTQDDGSLTAVFGAVVTFTDHQPAIPDRVNSVSAKSDTTGQFSAHLPAANWDLLVSPPASAPPMRGGGQLNTSMPSLDLRLPKPSSLLHVNGVVKAAGTPLTGARVGAEDASGLALSAFTNSADGGFSLLLPPGTSSYFLEVGPPTEMDGGVTNADPLPVYEGWAANPPQSPVLDLPLPAAATLKGRVADSAGSPVAYAHVYARSTATSGWSLSRATVAGTDGSYSLALREGVYLVEAAPDTFATSPSVSAERTMILTAAGATLDFSCPPKARAFGMVRKPDGTPAGAGYQINATRLADDLLTTRPATSTPTDQAGFYHLIGDNGSYRVEVQPPSETGLPRKVVQLDLAVAPNEYPLPDIQISAPVEVVGTVTGTPPSGVAGPIAGATVDFYALDASGKHTVRLGSGVTDSQGRYKAVLPDVPQPTLVH
jgi:hypothetical protein